MSSDKHEMTGHAEGTAIIPSNNYGAGSGLVDAGSRSNEILKASFPNSPIMWSNDPANILTDETVTEDYKDAILNNSSLRGFLFPVGVDMNYGASPTTGIGLQPPDIHFITETIDGEIFDGSDGAPIRVKTIDGFSCQIPTNMSSPARDEEGSLTQAVGATPNFQSKYIGPVIEQKSINYGSGPSSPANPADQSIGSQDFTDLTMGKSS